MSQILLLATTVGLGDWFGPDTFYGGSREWRNLASTSLNCCVIRKGDSFTFPAKIFFKRNSQFSLYFGLVVLFLAKIGILFLMTVRSLTWFNTKFLYPPNKILFEFICCLRNTIAYNFQNVVRPGWVGLIKQLFYMGIQIGDKWPYRGSGLKILDNLLVHE